MKIALAIGVILLISAGSARANHEPVTMVINGTNYQCTPSNNHELLPIPEFKIYCVCKQLFGRTTLNLMSFDPLTGVEVKVREVAQISGSAVYPAMDNCRKAIKNGDYPECSQ